MAQVFIPFGYWQCLPKIMSDVSNADFLLGTTSNATISGASVQLSAGQVLGTFTSRIFDGLSDCAAGSAWANIKFEVVCCRIVRIYQYGKALTEPQLLSLPK
jgi:hypothetical protein